MEVVGDFEFGDLGLLGSGAFAAVFKGRHVVNKDHIVAVKKIKKSVLPDLSSKEIKILKELTKLHHENVVNLLDCKDGPQFVYLIMEYCNAGTLADYMQARGILAEATISMFFSQIANAMKSLCMKGIVHRDLKPHNILLCHSGKSNPSPDEITVKIADFGFARFLQSGVMAGTICGSPLYMAPEILVTGRYDAKADLWSIAVIVYQCHVGRPPFPANSITQLQKLYEHNPDIQPTLPSSTSVELTDFLVNLLKINPRTRMDFDSFFDHPFLKLTHKTDDIDRNKSDTSLSSVSSKMNILSSSPLRCVPIMEKTNEKKHRQHRQKQQQPATHKFDSDLKRTTTERRLNCKRNQPKTSHDSRPLSPNLDGFVIVPFTGSDDDNDVLMAMPSNHLSSDVDSMQSGHYDSYSSLDRENMSPANSPHRTSSPISVPRRNNPLMPNSRPVSLPYQLNASKHGHNSPSPVQMKAGYSPVSHVASMTSHGSLSPPAVQFMVGTPSSGTCSRCVSASSLMAHPHHSGTPPCSYGSMQPMSCESSSGYCTQASGHPTLQGPVSFIAPEFTERTLMSRDHNELMLKLEFTRDLSNSLIQIARSRSSPLTEPIFDDVVTNTSRLSTATGSAVFISERQRVIEQLLLYMRALDLLGSALNIARSALSSGHLQSSPLTRQILREINTEYQQCLIICKSLSEGQLASDLSPPALKPVVMTDKLIYSCAIEMCQSAVMDELLGEMNECCRQYQMAYLLLHSLLQQASNDDDRKQLSKYKDGVEKRLLNLFNLGFINAKFMTS